MIERTSITNCYKPFMKTQGNFTAEKPDKISHTTVKIASLTASAIGALGAAYFVSRHQSQKLKQAVNLFGVKYGEKELTGVALTALATGLGTGCLIDDKKHMKAKLNEGVHQAVANILFPLAIVGAVHKIYDKFADKIKLPQFNQTNSVKKCLNTIIKVAPSLVLTLSGLTAGVFLGTKVANIINRTNEPTQQRKVKPLDFCYHPDDVATALVLADKTGAIQKTVGKIIPFVFMLHGYEAGSKR